MGDKMQTDWMALEAKTKVFRHGAPIHAMPYMWYVFEAKPCGEVLQLSENPSYCQHVDRLPREFFNHELLECVTRRKDGTYDAKSLAAFVSKWGAPLSPYRFWPYGLDWLVDKPLADAMALTDEAGGIPNPDMDGFKPGGGSVYEVAHAIEKLQGDVLLLHEAIREWDGLDRRDSHTLTSLDLECEMQSISLAARYPRELALPESVTCAVPHGLTGAICNQIIEAIADVDTPWRECAAPGCNKRHGAPVIFKYQHGDATTQKNPNAAYCSARCRERHRKQMKRAGKRDERKG